MLGPGRLQSVAMGSSVYLVLNDDQFLSIVSQDDERRGEMCIASLLAKIVRAKSERREAEMNVSVRSFLTRTARRME